MFSSQKVLRESDINHRSEADLDTYHVWLFWMRGTWLFWMRVYIRKGRRSMYGKASAAIMVGPNRPLQVETIDLDDPGFGEVVVRLKASGVCHSDISFLEGKWPAPLPHILGHEGAGTIEAVGPGVSSNRVGENVVLTFVPGCGVQILPRGAHKPVYRSSLVPG